MITDELDDGEIEADDAARVLVVIARRPADLARARAEGWYHIPQQSAPPQLQAAYLAFYQTAAFGADGRWQVRYYAPIVRYRVALRRELFPDAPAHPRADAFYYRVELGPFAELPLPLPARRLRRIVFITTTLAALRRAHDVAELFAAGNATGEPPDLWGAGLAGRSLR